MAETAPSRLSPSLVLPHGGGGEDFLEHHYPNAPRPFLDLSTGINPFAYPHDGVPAAAWQKLPSPSLQEAARAAAAACFGVNPRNIAILPGSQAAIALLPRLFPRVSVAALQPSYNEHRACWLKAGHTVHDVAADAIEKAGEDILVLANPNNPDGRVWPRAEIVALAQSRSARSQWLIVDEAFADSTPDISAVGAAGRYNLVVLRSFGKFFGLAGVRLGFAVAPENIARALENEIGPWAVSGPALSLAAKAYGDFSWQDRTRELLRDAGKRLRAIVARAGMEIAGSTDLFVLAEHDRAAEIFERLCRAGIYVRRFTAEPSWLRFGLPGDADAERRLDAGLQDRATRV